MKNKIFKVLALAVASIMAVICLASCSPFKCDICGEEKTGKKHEALGSVVCNDCYDEFSSMLD